MSSISPSTQNLIGKLPKSIHKFVRFKESDTNLASVRLGQDIAVNWLPKIPFSRSIADFADTTFMEFSENILVYFGSSILGQHVFRKLFTRKLSPELEKKISMSAKEVLSGTKKEADSIMPIKAAIALGGLLIPIGEYALCYAKNIFTMSVFKQADFNNIANLNKDKVEKDEQQMKVKKSAIKHIRLAGMLSVVSIAMATLFAVRGRKSPFLKSISEIILNPGYKIFRKNTKRAEVFNKYFSLDFENKNGRLGLSRGQLSACVVAGFFGYTGAAKDRGKQNLLEVLFRYPLVGFYVITGSEMFEKGFKTILKKTSKYKELLKEEKLPDFEKLAQMARANATKNCSEVEKEFKSLFMKKAFIISAPFFFSIFVMGVFIAGMSRLFTQYRYNREKSEVNS